MNELKMLKESYQPEMRPLKDWKRKLDEQIASEQDQLTRLTEENQKAEAALAPPAKKGAKAPPATAPVRPFFQHAETLANKLRSTFDNTI